MKEATIGKEQPQPLYQRGKYPSVIDTDDLVFEMGVQLVGNLNKEKLLDNVINKTREAEAAIVIAEAARKVAEDKVAPLKLSNEQYVQNNQKLDAELVKVRQTLEAERKGYAEELSVFKSKYKEETKQLQKLIKGKSAEIKELKRREKKG